MSTIVKLAQNKQADATEPLSVADLTKVVEGFGNGVDGWGHEIKVLVSSERSTTRDVAIVSPGRDGELDFLDEEAYFALSPVDIRGLLDRDIVFVNGRCITNAGKDPHSGFPPAES